MLLFQSLCAQSFERPKLETSEFLVRKGLLIKKAPTKKMEALVVPQIHLKKEPITVPDSLSLDV